MNPAAMNRKILVLRADADTQMGTGHLMRCLALAQAWKADGGRVVFASHCESDILRRRITDAGMELIPIAQSHPAPQDLQTTLELLRKHSVVAIEIKPFPVKLPGRRPGIGGQFKIGNRQSKIENMNWLVLDGYHFDPAYQQAIQSAGFRLLVIDDMANLSAYHADIILNQNLGAEKLKYNCSPGTRLLLGPRYALLRQEFMSWRGWRREIPEVARKVLVTMGGSDPDNVTLKVIHALRDIDVEAKIIVGGSNPHYAELQSAIGNLPCVAPWAKKGRQAEIIVNATNMPELMAWADVAVTAGGSTCWELAFMGLPSVVLVLAENQRMIAKQLDDEGMAINLGWYDKMVDRMLSDSIEKLIKGKQLRATLSSFAQKMVDGRGVKKVYNILTD